MRAQLIPLQGGPPIDVVKEMTLVGRKEDCDVRLDHKSISKMHCVLVKTDGLLFLRDLGSTNGTRVNGQRVRRAALLPNDQLAIAGFLYRVFFGPDEERPAEQPYEHTQRMNAKDVAQILGRPDAPAAADSAPDLPVLPVVQNPLPDVYPDGK